MQTHLNAHTARKNVPEGGNHLLHIRRSLHAGGQQGPLALELSQQELHALVLREHIVYVLVYVFACVYVLCVYVCCACVMCVSL
jgi:hypothetical protein